METYPQTTPKRNKLIQTALFGVPEYEIISQRSYRTSISPEQFHKLWRLKQRTKKPITKLVAEALDLYLKTQTGGDR